MSRSAREKQLRKVVAEQRKYCGHVLEDALDLEHPGTRQDVVIPSSEYVDALRDSLQVLVGNANLIADLYGIEL